MNKKQKLELTWIGKDEQPPREVDIIIRDVRKHWKAKA